ncbi:MAG: VOC family protein [Hyphomicrobiales bacterium]|nr:VOC family protein [Hyphomicrobiales bacterium]
MIDHFGFGVSDYERAKAFYTKVLAQLDIDMLMDVPAAMMATGSAACGFGRRGKPDFWISAQGKTTPPVHLALRTETRAQVDAFYRAALEAGATDNGPPGVRLQYHSNYYGAFVRDLDGHNIEAVCHTPPAT